MEMLLEKLVIDVREVDLRFGMVRSIIPLMIFSRMF